MILLIDNYDSFTYNLYQYVCEIENDVQVIRNDALTIQDIRHLQPKCILFSPGAGHPKHAGIMEDIISIFYKDIPMLGICLGHQGIADVFHCTITHASVVKHGECDKIKIDTTSPLFQGLDSTICVARYHSLIVENIQDDLKVIATSSTHEIMAIQHKKYPVYGVQFHPESIMTPDGKEILKNFLKGEHNIC